MEVAPKSGRSLFQSRHLSERGESFGQIAQPRPQRAGGGIGRSHRAPPERDSVLDQPAPVLEPAHLPRP